jgi:hypothetical protein
MRFNKSMEPEYTKKDWLETYYIQGQYSIKLVAAIAKCNPTTIRKWLRKHGIAIRPSKESRAIEVCLKLKAKTASEKLCTAVGDFALSFERLCRDLRLGIWAVLEANGLKDAWYLTDIFVGDLTAFPLQNIFRALISQTRKCNAEEKLALGDIFKRMAAITETRNSVLHSAWYIDYKSRADLLTDTYTKYRPGYDKAGAKPTPTKHSIEEVERAAVGCLTLSELISCLQSCILMNKQFGDYLHMVDRQAAFIDPGKKSAYR